MKKLISVLLTAAMVTALAAGCGNQTTQGTTAAPAETTAAATTAAPAETTTAKATTAAATTSGNAGTKSDIVDNLGTVEAKAAYKIGFTISARDQFLSAMEAAASAQASALGVDMTVVDANNNANTQIQNVQTFAGQKVNAIIVNLVNSDNMSQIQAAAGDIPVVFINRKPAEELEKGKATYVGSDENNSGRFQGEFLAKHFKDKGKTELNVVVLQGILGLQHTILRTESAMKALEDGGMKVNVIYEDTAEFDRAKAQNKMQTFLGTNQDFDCVIANNDEMALGAIEAMKSVGLDLKEKVVVGIDATPAGLASMDAGELAFTVFQNPVGQGAGAVRAAVLFANGDAVDTVVDIPFEPVSMENYKDYMK